MTNKASVFFLIFCAGLVFWAMAAGAGWLYLDAQASNQEAFASGRQLIVHSSSYGFLPGAALGVFAVGLYLLVALALVPFGEEVRKTKGVLVQKVAAVVMVAALMLTLLGQIWLSHRWEATAKAKGYSPCPPLTLLINRMTYTAWTRDVSLCTDPQVSQIVQRGGPEESKEVEALLQSRQ